MISNYLLTALRSMWKNKTHAIVNVLGLSLGITCALVIFLTVRFELSFDRYHADEDRIFRVVTEYTGDKPGYNAGITYVLPEALRQDFPDLEKVTVVDCNFHDPVITVVKSDGVVERFKEKNVTLVDPDYFSLFSYRWKEGNERALEQEKTVVLTESIAKKYFGSEPAVGKVLNFDNRFEATVTGVVNDPPHQTDLPFRIFFSSRLGSVDWGWDTWNSTSSTLNCYIKLAPGTSKEEFEAKLTGWHLKYFTGNDEEDGKNRRYFLQPLSEIHFDNRFFNIAGRVVSPTTLWTLSIIGAMLLLTACVNFINLNTVLIVKRSREAGIRKVMGSTQGQLVFQFLGETFFVTLLAILISIALTELVLINFYPVIGYQLSLMTMLDGPTIIYLLVVAIVVTLLAGFYPALRLSWFQPVKTLKSVLSANYGEGKMLRRGLIVFQLLVSQILIVATLLIVRQIDYFVTRPLGLNSETVVNFMIPERKPEVLHALSERIHRLTGVESMTMSNTGGISYNTWTGDFEATVDNKVIKENTHVKMVDANFVKTYQLEIVAGEDLLPSDTANRFLVNERFVHALGFKEPNDALGTPVTIWGRKALIKGVVKDFNVTPLYQKLEPVIIMTNASSYFFGSVRLKTSDLSETLSEVQKVWEEIFPKHVFEYAFLDNEIAQFYEGDRRNSYVLGSFAGVAVLIGCVGLFGLISFMAQSKVKEIGIRKTFGASVSQIVRLLSKEFVTLTIISFTLAVPVVYYFMDQWLSNFAYRITISPLDFLFGLLSIFVISALTVGYRSVKAATANPSDTLRAD